MMKLTPENLQKNEDLKSSAQKAKKAGGASNASEKQKAVESVVAAAAKEKKRRRESMLEKVRRFAFASIINLASPLISTPSNAQYMHIF